MTTTPALLPCPFCEGEAAFSTHRTSNRETIRLNNRDSGFGVNCVACGIGTRVFDIGYSTEEKAAERWNTLAPCPRPCRAGVGAVTDLASTPAGSGALMFNFGWDAAHEYLGKATHHGGPFYMDAISRVKNRCCAMAGTYACNCWTFVAAPHPQAAPPRGDQLDGWSFELVAMGRGDERYIGAPSGNGMTVGNRGSQAERMLFELANTVLAVGEAALHAVAISTQDATQ